MSLFPAYSLSTATEKKQDVEPPLDTPSTNLPESSKWLENNSFALQVDQIKDVKVQNISELPVDTDTDEDEPKEDQNREEKNQSKKHRHHKCRKKSPKHKHERKKHLATAPLEFKGDEEFYVDKLPARLYKTIRTLHKPACPRYRCHFRRKLGLNAWYINDVKNGDKSLKRYYSQITKSSAGTMSVALDENEYNLRLGKLNRTAVEAPQELQTWLNLIALQEQNPYRWSRLMLAENKLELLRRALLFHPRSECIYRLYIDIISATYPSFEVSKILDDLLSKDPYNYTIWTAQIMTTQGSMARCLVPDVLRIYERCMQKMHHACTTNDGAGGSDTVMLKLFSNCALFLRQAGLYEQFFALLKLALELNVSTDQFGDFAPLESDQRTLIEYEELILQSGLPMNEIWLRIEKLRQGFNFLPCPINSQCADPQRVVFNEDVCHYIYPFKSRDNSFYLMLQILRLLKLPFVQCDGLAGKFCARVEHIGDSDAVEDVLAVGIKCSFALPPQDEQFLSCLFELSKEMAVSPTFLSSAIGHEIYTRCLTQMLMNCAATQAGIDERKRNVFLLLWCRLERLMLHMQKCNKKLTADYIKASRSRFKALLKQPPNRNVLNLYTEFAIYEFEILAPTDSLQPVENIFENLIAANSSRAEDTQNADLCHTYVCYAEILIGRAACSREEVLQVIAAYALDINIKIRSSISAAKQLAAFQKLTEKLNNLVAIESSVDIMVLEQYLLPDYTVSLLKLRTFMQYLMGQKLESMSYMDMLLQTFRYNTSDRHCYLRERIQELYVTIMQLPSLNSVVTEAVITERLLAALKEFPRNMFLMQRCGMLTTVPWYKIRSALLRHNPSMLSVTFLIAIARYRFMQMSDATQSLYQVSTAALTQWDCKYNEKIVRNRILNMFKALSPMEQVQQQKNLQHFSPLHRNALFWRFYLRCLSDQSTAFETSKKCLLTALDECPWSKALYLDGATYVPQELSHLQDLIIEKQLRIYALPEELEILREK